ncbi:MAG TPA: hypothetical protein VM425_07955 [Myxococcota bacterium]|nr:hypothetical protein [Myxococcota bacterium]
MKSVSSASVFFVLAMCSACAGSGGGDNTGALAYVGIGEGKVFDYDIDIGLTQPQAGEVKVVGIDLEYADGLESYKVEMRQNGNLIATRWYQVTAAGLFLLGEDVNEGASHVERRYLTPVKLLPYPLENEQGFPVQSWSTQTDVEQGGSEMHRFDNSGKESIQVPAGTFEVFHLVHTRTKDGTDTTALEEYFSPKNWYVQFEYPKDSTWQLK